VATSPSDPPREPVPPLDTPPDPGEVQTTPMPMNRLIQHFHKAPLALVVMLALALGLSACGKESSSGAASAPGGATAPAAGPAPAASSPASGLPASQLGSMPTGGSKNSTNTR
jgi:hypothetical protein